MVGYTVIRKRAVVKIPGSALRGNSGGTVPFWDWTRMRTRVIRHPGQVNPILLPRLAPTLCSREHFRHRIQIFRLYLALRDSPVCEVFELQQQIHQRHRVDQPGRDQRRCSHPESRPVFGPAERCTRSFAGLVRSCEFRLLKAQRPGASFKLTKANPLPKTASCPISQAFTFHWVT